MKNRGPIAIIGLTIITLGIYSVVWEVKTKGEMVALGADIPSSWLLIVPFANIYWLWKYCKGVEQVTRGSMSGVMSFILLYLLGAIGMAIIQSEFNKVAAGPLPAAPYAPMAGVPVAPIAPPVQAAPFAQTPPSIDQNPPVAPVV